MVKVVFFCWAAFVFSLLYALVGADQGYGHIDLKRDPPSQILSLLTARCIKHEDSCAMNVQMNIILIEDIIKLFASFPNKAEPELMADLDFIMNELQDCKDAGCVQNFERDHGRTFEKTMTKARSIARASEDMTKFADKNHIFMYSEFFN